MREEAKILGIFLTIAVLFVLTASALVGQTRTFPGAVGAGSNTLVPSASHTPSICSVNSVGDNIGDSGDRTLRYCAEGAGSVGFNLVVFFEAPGCVFTVGGAGEGQIEIVNDSTVILGGTCQAGAIHLRTLSHALAFGAPAFSVENSKHVLVADVYGWDQDCGAVPGCSGGDQKQFRFGADDNGYMLRVALAGNSNDDIMSVCAPSIVPSGCQDITMHDVVLGPIKKSPDVGGEGQCSPTGNNAERLSIFNVVCAQAGHRAFILNCIDCEIDNFSVTGQGGRSMEAYYPTFVSIRNSVWRTMYPRNGGNHSEVFRYRENIAGVIHAQNDSVKIHFANSNISDTLLPSGDSLPNWNVTGEDFVTLAYNAGSRCEGGSTFLMNGCTDGGQTVDTADVLSRTKPFADLINRPPEISAQTFWTNVMVNHQIGPRYLTACDGTITSSDNLRPFTKTHLTRQNQGRIPNNENDWPTQMSTWAVGGDNWPDTTSVGRPSCTDTSPNDGIPDEFVARLGALTADPDGDNYPNWNEVYVSMTDPLAANNDDGSLATSIVPTFNNSIFVILKTTGLQTIVTDLGGISITTRIYTGSDIEASSEGFWCYKSDTEGVYITTDTVTATALDSITADSLLTDWNLRGCGPSSIITVPDRIGPIEFQQTLAYYKLLADNRRYNISI